MFPVSRMKYLHVDSLLLWLTQRNPQWLSEKERGGGKYLRLFISRDVHILFSNLVACVDGYKTVGRKSFPFRMVMMSLRHRLTPDIVVETS